MPRAAIIGNGSWGTTLGIILARKEVNVKLWARDQETADKFNQTRENSTYLPGFQFPPLLSATHSLEEATDKADIVILAVPSDTMRRNVRLLRDYVSDTMIVASAAKGLEIGSGKRMSQVISEEIDHRFHSRICAISGPNMAKEAAQGLLSVTVVAARDVAVAEKVQQILNSDNFYVFTSTDLIGVELGGSLKNVIALGVGMIDGLGNGNNAKVALIIRGLSEIIVLGTTFGANPLTFMGLSGLGDLVVTCFSPSSRNFHVGREMARGRSLKDILDSMPHVAEGVSTTFAARQLGQRAGLSLPVVEQTYRVIYEGLDVRKAASELVEYPVDGKSPEITKLFRFMLDYVRTRWNRSPSWLLDTASRDMKLRQ